MREKDRSKLSEISPILGLAFLIGGSLVVLFLFTGYFLALAWLLTVLAPLTFQQAATAGVLVLASSIGFMARYPMYDLPMVVIIILASTVLALAEVLMARLVAAFTPLSVWEAYLLLIATGALLLFTLVQMMMDNDLGEVHDGDDENDEPALDRLSPDMYVVRNWELESPPPRSRRTGRRRTSSRRRTDESDTN